MPPKKRSKRRGSQETERMSTRARSPEVDELSCVPETQQAAGVEELVVGVEDPLEMSDTEQGETELETQQDLDTSDEDTQDTQAAAATTQNEILYNKRLMDYKDRSKREAVWRFCEENNLDTDACQKWFQSQSTLFMKVTHMKSGQGEPVLTERQKRTRDNFDFLRDHIMHHLTAKSEVGAPKGSASQASAAADLSSRWETVHCGSVPGYFSSRVNLLPSQQHSKYHRAPLHHHSCMSCHHLLQRQTLDAKEAHHSPAHQ